MIDSPDRPASPQTPGTPVRSAKNKLLAKAALAAAKKKEADGTTDDTALPEPAASTPLPPTQPNTPLQTDAPPFPDPVQSTVPEPTPELAQLPPALSAEDQAKIDAVAAELQAAEGEVEQATAAAKKLKDVADAEEATAAKLEAESAGNTIKKARASAARRKATAAAKAAAPGLKATEEATVKRDAIQARLEALRLSLTPVPSPAITTAVPPPTTPKSARSAGNARSRPQTDTEGETTTTEDWDSALEDPDTPEAPKFQLPDLLTVPPIARAATPTPTRETAPPLIDFASEPPPTESSAAAAPPTEQPSSLKLDLSGMAAPAAGETPVDTPTDTPGNEIADPLKNLSKAALKKAKKKAAKK
jgi:hypothetical protein